MGAAPYLGLRVKPCIATRPSLQLLIFLPSMF
jgi:hypothetical protein